MIDIERITEQAVESYFGKPSRPEYYSDKFRAITPDEEKLLAEAYMLRGEPFSSKAWINLYAEWLNKNTRKDLKQGVAGMKELCTMGVFYWTKVKNNKTYERKVETSMRARALLNEQTIGIHN